MFSVHNNNKELVEVLSHLPLHELLSSKLSKVCKLFQQRIPLALERKVLSGLPSDEIHTLKRTFAKFPKEPSKAQQKFSRLAHLFQYPEVQNLLHIPCQSNSPLKLFEAFLKTKNQFFRDLNEEHFAKNVDEFYHPLFDSQSKKWSKKFGISSKWIECGEKDLKEILNPLTMQKSSLASGFWYGLFLVEEGHDVEKGVFAILLAAEKGYPYAQFTLGQFYDPNCQLHKTNLKKDAQEARKWYSKK